MARSASTERGAGEAGADRRRRTRERILVAATAIIRDAGYDRMSMEAVAQAAGVTRRTVYAHFKNKDDLIIAVVRQRAPPIAPPPKPGVSFKDHMKVVGRAVAAAASTRERNAITAASFELYSLTHPEMLQRIRTESAQIYRMIEQGVRAQWRDDEMPMSAAHFVRVVHAMTDGLLSRRALMPEEFTDEVIIAAFEALG